MLAALLVTVLAATFTLVVVGAVHSLQVVERSDAAAWRAETQAGRALAAVTAALRWRPATVSGSVAGDAGVRQSWEASWARVRSVEGDAWPRLRVDLLAAAGGSRRHDELTMQLRAEPWAAGVTCSGDADVEAPLVVSGSGVYVGGCLRGREHVDFAPGDGPATPTGEPADGVHGDVFAAAAVHCGAGVFASGVEIHEAAVGDPYPFDTDFHAGEAIPEEWVEPPSGEFLLAAAAVATPVEGALTGGRLLLDAISVPVGADAGGGSCIVPPAIDEVTIEGSASPETGRLLVVVRGDAIVGQPGEAVSFSGCLVVLGHLHVRGSLFLEGSLHAGSLSIGAPVRVTLAAEWRDRPVAGGCRPTLVENGP
jgi:hypothetical protein